MKSHNAAFEKALSLLIHPFSIAMLALLLVNDHLLRRLWPSWWSGKLGDVAWLGFAPFALAALLAWILPLREPTRTRWTARLSFLLVGGVFALGKTLPAAHTLVANMWQAMFGAPPALVRDPSDLLALPILLVSWRLWQTQPPLPSSQRRLASGLVTLAFAALLTIANSAAPDYGITCLVAENGIVYANAGYRSFSSSDGGLTWPGGQGFPSSTNCQSSFQSIGDLDPNWQTVEVPSSRLTLRYRPGQDVEASKDAGQTWESVFPVEYTTPAQAAYIIKTRQGNPMVFTGPFQAVVDSASGNVVFAMGHDGVLVRTAAGQWQWSAVGPYQRTSAMPDLAMLWVLLSEQFLLAIGAALVVFFLTGMRYITIKRKLLYVLLWIYGTGAVLAWGITVFLFPPTISSYGYIVVAGGLIASAVLLFPLALLMGVDIFREKRAILPRLLLVALAGAVLYLLPSLLWAYNLLPTSGWVIGLSLALVTAAVVFGLLKANVKSATSNT